MVSLHTHSWYSLLEGASSPPALLARAADHGYTALALTDTNNLYGAVAFVEQAVGHGRHSGSGRGSERVWQRLHRNATGWGVDGPGAELVAVTARLGLCPTLADAPPVGLRHEKGDPPRAHRDQADKDPRISISVSHGVTSRSTGRTSKRQCHRASAMQNDPISDVHHSASCFPYARELA